MSVRTRRRRPPGPTSAPSQLMSRPWASKVLPLVRPLLTRKTDTLPSGDILSSRLPAMSLKRTLPWSSTAGPSRKQTPAAAVAFVSGGTRSAGSGARASGGLSSALRQVGATVVRSALTRTASLTVIAFLSFGGGPGTGGCYPRAPSARLVPISSRLRRRGQAGEQQLLEWAAEFCKGCRMTGSCENPFDPQPAADRRQGVRERHVFLADPGQQHAEAAPRRQ